MGTNTLASYSDGDIIPDDSVNQHTEALQQDLVPRNTSGVATDSAGSLGTSSLEWKRANIKAGYLKAGDIKMHHSYNGAVGPGQGWMLMDGRLVNETNYDTEHSSGDWDLYIISSELDGKYLPNMTDKYPVGKATTTQNGSSAITSVGNSSNQVDFQHRHTINHVHQFYNDTGLSNHDQVYNASGNATDISSQTKSDTYRKFALSTSTSVGSPGDSYTSTPDVTNSGYELSTTQSIQPESIEVQYYMRII